MAATTISVIGMHRSGTSLVARLLNIAGAYLGDEQDLAQADKSNQAGYWENFNFIEFNDQIIEHFGGSWFDPPALPANWLEDDFVCSRHDDACRYIDMTFADHAVWGWKEPRTTLLIPFWETILPGCRYVVCVRNPLDVAASLAKRDAIVLEHGVALWHLYTMRALLDTAPSSRRIVGYEDLLANHRPILTGLFRFLLPQQAIADAQWAEIDRFIDGSLEHHRHSLDDVLKNPRLLDASKRLYAALARSDIASINAALAESTVIAATLRDITHSHSEIVQVAHERDRLQTILDKQTEELELVKGTLNTRLHRLAAKLSQRANRAPTLTSVLRKLWRS